MAKRRYPDATEVELGYFELSTHLIALEVLRRGYTIEWINRSFFLTDFGGDLVGFWCTRTTVNGGVGIKVSTRKDITRRLMERAGVPVAAGGEFRSVEAAAEWIEHHGYPVVVKPIAATKGRGVTVGIRDREGLEIAWSYALAAQRGNRLLVEQVFTGREARFLVVGDRCVGVYGRVSPRVTGDGTRTIRDLIAAKNEARRANPHLKRRLIELTDHRIAELKHQGYGPDDVLEDGVEVVLDENANLSIGADSVELTNTVHPSLKAAAERAVRAVPGLSVAGVDIIAKDLTSPDGDGHVVLELNTMPGIGAHHSPAIGEPRDAAGAIVDWHVRRYRPAGLLTRRRRRSAMAT